MVAMRREGEGRAYLVWGAERKKKERRKKERKRKRK